MRPLKYTDADIERMRDRAACGVSTREIADDFRCHTTEVNRIVKGLSYKRVPLRKRVGGADLLAWQLNAAGGLLAQFQREFRIIEARRFRWDFAYPRVQMPLAIEVQGYGVAGGQGGHQTFTGMRRDAEKSALLAINGWRGMAVTTDDVRSGRALGWIQQALA